MMKQTIVALLLATLLSGVSCDNKALRKNRPSLEIIEDHHAVESFETIIDLSATIDLEAEENDYWARHLQYSNSLEPKESWSKSKGYKRTKGTEKSVPNYSAKSSKSAKAAEYSSSKSAKAADGSSGKAGSKGAKAYDEGKGGSKGAKAAAADSHDGYGSKTVKAAADYGSKGAKATTADDSDAYDESDDYDYGSKGTKAVGSDDGKGAKAARRELFY